MGLVKGSQVTVVLICILFLSISHYINIKHGAGHGTKNWAELYTLWLLIKTAADRGIPKLQVLGDSKLLIDWANGKNMIINLVLSLVMSRVVEIKRRFEAISSLHIYWEFNIKANQLSKEALYLQEGIITIQEFRDGALVSESRLSKLPFLIILKMIFLYFSYKNRLSVLWKALQDQVFKTGFVILWCLSERLCWRTVITSI
jgi:hypothetical protein